MSAAITPKFQAKELLQALEGALPSFLQSQRWYRAKAKRIRRVSIEDTVPMALDRFSCVITRVEYTDDQHETYLLPLESTPKSGDLEASDIVARVPNQGGEEQFLSNALSNSSFRASLLQSIAKNETFAGSGQLICRQTAGVLSHQETSNLDSKISRAEQSNSSIIFGSHYILKLFRRLETGVNPDIEIGKFLTRQQFTHTPAVLGEILYRTASGDESYAGILQQFVPNEGDAWKHALDSLSGFFERALRDSAPPPLQSADSFELLSTKVPAAARQTIGEYVESARLLGIRSAQMHAALSSDVTDPDFAPEPLTLEYAEILYREMMQEADRAFGLLRDKARSLPGEAANAAEKLLANEAAVRDRFANLQQHTVTAQRIRHHGDYHLGQVLSTGNDFVIIDFEGEPLRPLAARRVKTLAMRDVAGMLRSFSYAAYAGLFGQVAGVPNDSGSREVVARWAEFWSVWVSAEFLKGYFETAQGSLFVGSDPAEQKLLLDVFLLQKALYETSYELNNRPDWVNIPLHGILSLIT